MDAERLRGDLIKKFGFVYTVNPCVDVGEDLLTIDGLSEEGTHYVVAKLSNGQILRENYDAWGEIAFSLNDSHYEHVREEDINSIRNIREHLRKGVNPKIVFNSTLASHFLLPKDKKFEIRI
ncbi:MAG: hypothetical protein U9Q06_02115 [Nanoarchaeota archaeon]|nr:hypothetical protein [Nanoarchaeota archaeon]